MDVVADADGNPDQDIRRFPNFEDKQEEGMEIQYDLVLEAVLHREPGNFIFFRKKNLLKEFLMRKIPKKKNPVHPGD